MKISCAVGVVAILSQPITVKADDTEDLLNIYGLTLGGPSKTDIESTIDDAESALASMQTHQSINEEHNAILREYIEKREAELNTILGDIEIYQSNNRIIESSINKSVLDSPIEELIELDNNYKGNVHKMNSLLSVMNDYKVSADYKSIQGDLSEVERRLEEAKSTYAQSVDTYNLGEVSNIEWILPNEKYITSVYGYRVDPLNSDEVRFHAGTDYRAPTGTPIGALFNGTVISCGWSDSIGYFVTVQCGDNVKYLICHCSELNVVVGQEVNQYDILAYSGGTGSRSTGPHLHLALYLNGVTYNVDELFK